MTAPALPARLAERRPAWRQTIWRLQILLLRITVLVVLTITGVLLLFQHRVIYHPQPYPPGVPLRAGIERVEFTTAEGRQVCWWIPGRANDVVWLCFAGNAGQARMWHDLLPDPEQGLLLIEFPGYGDSAGNASPASIMAASDGAVAVLRQRLGSLPPLAVLGHSLGAAAALQFAAAQTRAGTPVSRIILIAPFTRLVDMARLVVGWPLCHLLRHRFDNQRSLREIMDGPHPLPRIDIFHGLDDTLIPPAMSQTLVAEFPTINRHEITGADHNDVLIEIIPALQALIR